MEFETFAPLAALPFITHAFTLRTAANTRTADYESRLVQQFGYTAFANADQPHGAGVAQVEAPGLVTGVDALVTTKPKLPLVIRCADCAPVFIVTRSAIALIHSGKKGTLANIVGATLQAMPVAPGDCLAFIGPSIGLCHYEFDIWSGIEQQLRAAGVHDIHNPRICTACHLDRYFSYRAERGQTGRMFALLALT